MSQRSIVLKELRATGKVTRNWALRNYISRLSSIMLILKKNGVNFEAKDVDGDYVYTLLDKPKEIRTYYVNGIKVAPDKIVW